MGGKIGENIASCFEKLSDVKASELHSKLHRLSAIPIFVLSFLCGFSIFVFINRRHFYKDTKGVLTYSYPCPRLSIFIYKLVNTYTFANT